MKLPTRNEISAGFVSIIELLFILYIFLMPLLITTFTNELFEWPKVMFTYLMTILLLFFYLLKIIATQQLIIPKIPLLLVFGAFLLWTAVTTLTSINVYTSFWGYYSRFNGSLLSYLSYAMLAFIFLTELNSLAHIRRIVTALFSSAFLVAAFGVAQRLGVDKDFWVQHSWERVFSTLGQPNWLAAYLAPIILLAIAYAGIFFIYLRTHPNRPARIRTLLMLISVALLAALYSAALYFTRSRSGYLGLTSGLLFFGSLFFLRASRKIALIFGIVCIILLGVLFPRRSVLIKFIDSNSETNRIRLITWQGTLSLIRDHPIFGTGPETFAYSFLGYRPAQLNTTTEWDFLINKPHNEYLGVASGSGIPGLILYLLGVVGISYFAIRYLHKNRVDERWLLIGASLGGLVSLWVSNFFGFSVVPTQVLMVLLVGIVIALTWDSKVITVTPQTRYIRWAALGVTVIVTIALFVGWYRVAAAEILFVSGRSLLSSSPLTGLEKLQSSVSSNPFEPRYRQKLSEGYAIAATTAPNETQKNLFVTRALSEAQIAYAQNPYDYILRSGLIRTYLKLATSDSSYMQKAIELAEINTLKCPTSAYDHYYLATLLVSQGQKEQAKEKAQKALELRPGYGEAENLINTF